MKPIGVLMSEVVESATLAGKNVLNELKSRGPAYTVHDELNDNKCVGTMLDVCGGASISLDGRSKLVKSIRKNIPFDSVYNEWTNEGIRNWVMYKGCSDYRLIIITSNHRQEMSVNVAECNAAVKTLKDNGYDGVELRSWID
jgi:hypothetical protein